MITPKYSNEATNVYVIITLPKSSIRLEIRGVLVSPNPCKLFRNIHIIAGRINSTEFILRYLTAFAIITSEFEAVIAVIIFEEKMKTITVDINHQHAEIKILFITPFLILSGFWAPLFCPQNVDIAAPIEKNGIKHSIVILLAAVCATIMSVPSPFIAVCSTSDPNNTNESMHPIDIQFCVLVNLTDTSPLLNSSVTSASDKSILPSLVYAQEFEP